MRPLSPSHHSVTLSPRQSFPLRHKPESLVTQKSGDILKITLSNSKVVGSCIHLGLLSVYTGKTKNRTTGTKRSEKE
jgi:hypothetical protein